MQELASRYILVNGDGDNRISSLNASKGWLKIIIFAWKMRCKCLSVSQLFVCWCVVIKLNPPLEWRHERDGLAGDCLVPGTIETPDSRLQALLRWLHKCVIIWLRPGHSVGRGPVASSDVRNLSVAWISVRGSNMILCTNIVSDLEQKIELETNLREVKNLQ